MHYSKILFWTGFSLAAVTLAIALGLLAYARFFQGMPAAQDPSQPRPELVAEGVSVLPVYLLLGTMVVAVGLMAAGWLTQPGR